MMDWLALAAMITAATGVIGLIFTIMSSRRKNTQEHLSNRDKIQEVFEDLKATVKEHHRDNTSRFVSLESGQHVLASNQEVLFGMITDVDGRVADVSGQVAVLADTGKKLTVQKKSHDMVGVRLR